MVKSALARPMNLESYGNLDPTELATAYAFGLARNHGFIDGNKRTGWVAARLFLADNGLSLDFDTLDAIQTMKNVARGRIDEATLADWFRSLIKR